MTTEPILPVDAQVTPLSPVEHIYLRVDPNNPERAAELDAAFGEAVVLCREALDKLLKARYALLSAGYRSSHPVCEDIDKNLVRPLADRLEYVRRRHAEDGKNCWPAPRVVNQ